MNKQEIILYPDIRDKLSTFTIINCEHKELFFRLIGHTAVVYKCCETGQIMVFESNITVSQITGKSGVRLTPMGKWLSEYKGKVFVRTLEFDFYGTPYYEETIMIFVGGPEMKRTFLLAVYISVFIFYHVNHMILTKSCFLLEFAFN